MSPTLKLNGVRQLGAKFAEEGVDRSGRDIGLSYAKEIVSTYLAIVIFFDCYIFLFEYNERT